jgi:cytoskeleton protein RodZ
MIDPEDNPTRQAAPTSAVDELGARLRRAREAHGWTLADCAQALRLPAKTLERLEHGDFGDPEQFIFVRGALQGYARHLELPANVCDGALRGFAPAAPPPLVAVAETSSRRWLLQRYGTAATYIILTATIAVPLVWLGLRGGLERAPARIVSLEQAPTATAGATSDKVAAAPAFTPTVAKPTFPEVPPLRASMTPFVAIGMAGTGSDAAAEPAPAATPADGHTLTVVATADCWFEITSADGSKLDSGMLHAGDTRTWHSTSLLHVTLGNAGGVNVTSDGKPLPLDAWQHANVARFDLYGPAAGATEND